MILNSKEHGEAQITRQLHPMGVYPSLQQPGLLKTVFVVLEIIGGGPLLTEMYKCQDSTEIASVAKHNFVHDTTQRFLI